MKSLTTTFSQISKVSLYLAIFLIPLFFLPFGFDALDYSKQTLLLLLVFLSLIAWFFKQISQERIVLRENKLLYFAFLLIFIIFSLSTIFSLWQKASFWGWPLNVSDNLVAFASFLILAFLFANVFQNEKELFLAALLFLGSGAISGLYLILQLYGIFVLPFDFSRISSFNSIGSVYGAAIFLAVLFSLSLGLVFRTKKPILWFFSLILLTELVLIDFKNAWLIVFLGGLIVSIFSLIDSKEKPRFGWLACLMVILVLSIFFFFFPLRFSLFPSLPLEASPGSLLEINILKAVFNGGIKNILLGTGPGTFIFDYSRYHPALLNRTIFWGTRFSTGNSEVLDWFVTKGVLGGISLIFLLCLAIYFSIKRLARAEDPFGLKVGLLVSIIGLTGAGFLTFFNFTLWFAFWFLMGGLLFYTSKQKEIDLSSSSLRLISSFLFLAITVMALVLLIFQGQKYLAQTNYSKGIKLSQQGKIDQAIVYLQKATRLNPSVDVYWRDLAQLYLSRANFLSQESGLKPDRTRLINESISEGIKSLERAIDECPVNVANWNVKGFFYRSLIGTPKAGEIALASYQKAAELEPASPFAYGEMGRVYILMAQESKKKKEEKEAKEQLSLAVKSLEKAIKLKPDYAPAHYLLAVAYDQQGKKEEAIAKLEELEKISPRDIGASFQLGMLYWRKKETDKAQREFEKVIKLNPNYSNALYMLGLVYDKKGEKEKAEKLFEKVAQLNPKNEEVKKILENLKKGLPATEGIGSSQPPIGETPPEIQK